MSTRSPRSIPHPVPSRHATRLGSLVLAAPLALAVLLGAPARGAATPAAIPDKTGTWANFPTTPPDQANPFFLALGSNGRTCATCHSPKDAWTSTPGSLQKRFAATAGTDPIFLSLDGTNCPTLPVTTAAQHQNASSLLLSRGLIRVALTPPTSADFTITHVANPYGCSSTTSVSVYRRILATSNLVFLSSVMWDSRETTAGATIYADLLTQASDAVKTHAAAVAVAPAASLAAAVALELEPFTAQVTDLAAGPLSGAGGGQGGPAALASQAYAPGENTGPTARPPFTLYAAWEKIVLSATSPATLVAQASIGRGEKIFNTRPINITGATGLNSATRTIVTGTCGTCHNTPNVGSSSTGLLVDEGQAHVPVNNADLPLITLTHTGDGKTWTVTDPGAALSTGRWADVGKFKVPMLRGLAARAPYFHNGSAADLDQVVNFYNARFTLNLSAQEHADLVHFLGAL